MSEFDPIVEIVEWLPGQWERCEGMWLVGSVLGYIEHEVYGGFVLYHLLAGKNLGVCAQTEEAACVCLEQVSMLTDWFDHTPNVKLLGEVAACAGALIAQGYPLGCIEEVSL